MMIEAHAEVQNLKIQRARDRNRKPADAPSEGDIRLPGQKDIDRIIYSHAFLRLAGVTQILPPNSSLPRLHNRLTHSLKVSQMARSVSQRVIALAHNTDRVEYIRALGGLDPTIAEAAGLAHDLGHPPFGHAGEHQLDKLTYRDPQRVIDTHTGFEGNAQSFRIATKIEASHSAQLGMRLTAGTRAAILKYPWSRGVSGLRAKKFGYYLEDRAAFEDARAWLAKTDVGDDHQSLEANAMDLADDITYAVHDLEDFLSLGIIRSSTVLFHSNNFVCKNRDRFNPIEQLEDNLQTNYPDVFDRELLVAACRELSSQDVPHGQSDPLSLRLWRNQNLDYFMSSIEILDQPRGDKGIRIDLTPEAWHRVELFKFIAKKYVIERRDTALMQRSGNAMLKTVLVALRDWTNDKPEQSELPIRFQLAKKWMLEIDGQIGRHYLDFICMLSDAELADLSAALSGQSLPSAFSSG